MTTVSIVVFVILPIVVGFVVLPPLLNDAMSQFLPAGSKSNTGLLGDDASTTDLIDMIKNSGGALNYYQQILDQTNQ